MHATLPTIEMLPVHALKPYAGNARKHSKRQVRQIADSIKRFGFTNPVLISDEGEIVAGHGRVMAAKELGVDTVPTLRLSHLSAEERRASWPTTRTCKVRRAGLQSAGWSSRTSSPYSSLSCFRPSLEVTLRALRAYPSLWLWPF